MQPTSFRRLLRRGARNIAGYLGLGDHFSPIFVVTWHTLSDIEKTKIAEILAEKGKINLFGETYFEKVGKKAEKLKERGEKLLGFNYMLLIILFSNYIHPDATLSIGGVSATSMDSIKDILAIAYITISLYLTIIIHQKDRLIDILKSRYHGKISEPMQSLYFEQFEALETPAFTNFIPSKLNGKRITRFGYAMGLLPIVVFFFTITCLILSFIAMHVFVVVSIIYNIYEYPSSPEWLSKAVAVYASAAFILQIVSFILDTISFPVADTTYFERLVNKNMDYPNRIRENTVRMLEEVDAEKAKLRKTRWF